MLRMWRNICDYVADLKAVHDLNAEFANKTGLPIYGATAKEGREYRESGLSVHDWLCGRRPPKMVIKYEHHGREVFVINDSKGRHREHCLCFNGCARFKPGQSDNCRIAEENYAMCVKYGLTAPVCECPEYDSPCTAYNKSSPTHTWRHHTAVIPVEWLPHTIKPANPRQC